MADRLISEAAALNALRKGLPGGCSGKAEYIIEQLPTAQPETKLIAKITLNKEQVQDAVEKAKREILDAQPEVQLSPIEQALHGLSPEKQADFLINLMRGTLAYIDSRVALIRWLKEGKWNERRS